MCTGTHHHDQLARIHTWSSEEVDKLIELRVCFDKFRSTADFSEVHEAMQVQYECTIHKLETSDSETTEKQRLEVFKSEPSGSSTEKAEDGIKGDVAA